MGGGRWVVGGISTLPASVNIYGGVSSSTRGHLEVAARFGVCIVLDMDRRSIWLVYFVSIPWNAPGLFFLVCCLFFGEGAPLMEKTFLYFGVLVEFRQDAW